MKQSRKGNIICNMLNAFVSLDSFIIITCNRDISSLKFFKHETVDVTLACYDDKRIQSHKLYLHLNEFYNTKKDYFCFKGPNHKA